MAVERWSGAIAAVSRVADRGRRHPLRAVLLGLSLVALTVCVGFFAAGFGVGNRIDCNRFVSPWDTSLAPPPSVDPGAVKVKELPKATITPADKSKPTEHKSSGKVLAWRSIAGTEGSSRSGD